MARKPDAAESIEAPEAEAKPPGNGGGGPPPDLPPDPIPVTDPPAPINPPPSQAQTDWMMANPNYVATPHNRTGHYTDRGTLTSDGTFVSEDVMPIMDGNGSFGVGIPK